MSIIGRYGGEEFAVALPETDIHAAGQIAERLRIADERAPFVTDYGSISLTISVGAAVYHPDDHVTLDAVIDSADRAMYIAKRSGRNSVRVWTYPATTVTDGEAIFLVLRSMPKNQEQRTRRCSPSAHLQPAIRNALRFIAARLRSAPPVAAERRQPGSCPSLRFAGLRGARRAM